MLSSGNPGSRPLARVNRSSLCRARARLGEDGLETVFRQVAGPLATADTPGAWWRGLRLLALDGTQVDLPDSTSNGDTFDGPSTTGGVPFRFPQVRAVVLAEIGTHGVLDARLGGYRDGERSLAYPLAGSARPGDLVIADRGFWSVEFAHVFTLEGADLLGQAPVQPPRHRPGRTSGRLVSVDGATWQGGPAPSSEGRPDAAPTGDLPRHHLREGRQGRPPGHDAAGPRAVSGRRAGRALPGTLGDRACLRRDQEPPRPRRADQIANTGRRPAGAVGLPRRPPRDPPVRPHSRARPPVGGRRPYLLPEVRPHHPVPPPIDRHQADPLLHRGQAGSTQDPRTHRPPPRPVARHHLAYGAVHE